MAHGPGTAAKSAPAGLPRNPSASARTRIGSGLGGWTLSQQLDMTGGTRERRGIAGSGNPPRPGEMQRTIGHGTIGVSPGFSW
jgi:hypothetical protein